MIRDLNEQSRHVIDATAWVFAGVAGVSFWQNFALGVTILAGMVSLLLGCLRIYDRVRYGPVR
jgi:hypothetical protein